MDAWKRMIAAQGGDPDATLPVARETEQVLAEADGVLAELDAYAVGIAAWRLGAGRARKEDPVQAGAGVELHAQARGRRAGRAAAADAAHRHAGAVRAGARGARRRRRRRARRAPSVRVAPAGDRPHRRLIAPRGTIALRRGGTMER